VKLNTATNSTSTTEAATSSAVKTAYDLADQANTTANTALSGVSGTLIYDHTYSISGGVATFTAHVYCKGQEVTSTYADSCFTWSYRLDSAISGTPSVVSLGTGKTKTITISTLGYGGHVIGSFTPPA
jgi:phage-related tail fiber protein